MKKSDIYEITIKILGLYLFATSVISAIDGLIQAFGFVAMNKQEAGVDDHTNWNAYLIIAIANLVLLFAASAFLFFKAHYIVRKICSSSDYEENAKLFAEPKAIYEMSLIVTGLLLIIWTLPEFAYSLKNYIEAERLKVDHHTSDLKYMWLSVAKIVIGTFLLLLARQLSGYFGKSKKQTDELN